MVGCVAHGARDRRAPAALRADHVRDRCGVRHRDGARRHLRTSLLAIWHAHRPVAAPPASGGAARAVPDAPCENIFAACLACRISAPAQAVNAVPPPVPGTPRPTIRRHPDARNSPPRANGAVYDTGDTHQALQARYDLLHVNVRGEPSCRKILENPRRPPGRRRVVAASRRSQASDRHRADQGDGRGGASARP